MSADLRLAIVGGGRIAERGYLPALERARGVTLAGLVEPDRERRERLLANAANGSQARFPATPSLESLIEAVDPDALVIATPPALHRRMAELAAAAGIPTLIEKPPAPSSADAERIAALEPRPWIGFNRRFLVGKRMLNRARAAFEPRLRLELRYRRRSWGAYEVRDEALLDAAPHMVDLGLFLTGAAPRSVAARRIDHGAAELDLELERGRALIRCRTDRPYRERVEVRDERGRLLARNVRGGVRAGLAARNGRGEHPLVASLVAQLEAFRTAARGGSSSQLASAADGVAAMGVIEAARESARRGGERVLT